VSPPISKREEDEESSEQWRRRQFKGLDPSEFPDQPELAAAFGRWSLKAKGLGIVLVVSVVAVILSNFYASYRIEQAVYVAVKAAGGEHTSLRLSQDRTSCLLTLTVEERARFRESYQVGAFPRWCPWVTE
jgi:hypothetical protein